MRKARMRTEETQRRYEEYKRHPKEGCVICSAQSERELEHWRIVRNDFPYDYVAERHSMLVPKRHVAQYAELTDPEKDEFEGLQPGVEDFDILLKQFPRNQTVPDHLHYHLLKLIFEDV
ncbi:MAG: hypothetical protein WDZ79_00700 [Candidatus Paceibacterota bacterium]